ncbi:hypothetical protein Tco_0584410 [Tanacetum coccineum]
MSSASSAVTYTSVYTDFEPGRVLWGANEEISDGGSPRVIILGYDGLHMQSPHDPDYVPEPIYPEYIPLEDEHEFPAEEQPLPPVVSPTAESLGYVVESDPEEDLEEYEDDKTDDGPVDYPMDGGEDGYDDDGDSSGDDADDEDEDEGDEDDEDEEEEEEHLALADSAVVVPIVKLVSPPKGTKPALNDGGYAALKYHRPSNTTTTTVTIHTTTCLDRKKIIFPSPSGPPPKRLCCPHYGSRYEVGESSTARPTGDRGIDYGFVSTVDAEARRQGISEGLLGMIRRNLYALLEDAQDSKDLDNIIALHSIGLSQAVHHELQTHRDHVYAHETQIQAHQTQLQLPSTLNSDTSPGTLDPLIDAQARWCRCFERDMAVKRKGHMVEILRVMRDMRREMSDMQAELLALQGQ